MTPPIAEGASERTPKHPAPRLASKPIPPARGHFTGRCMRCGSAELWTDATAYGCEKCGASFLTQP